MENYIKSILGENFEIIKIIDYKEDVFIFFEEKSFSNPYNDERKRVISNLGPLKINKSSKKYSYTNIVEFIEEYGNNEIFFPKENNIIVDWYKVVNDIKLRKYVNWEDFDLLLEYENLQLNSFDIYSINKRDFVEIEVKGVEANKCLISFLNTINANYIEKSHHHYIVNLILPS
jgi:hypothetical protein